MFSVCGVPVCNSLSNWNFTWVHTGVTSLWLLVLIEYPQFDVLECGLHVFA